MFSRQTDKWEESLSYFIGPDREKDIYSAKISKDKVRLP